MSNSSEKCFIRLYIWTKPIRTTLRSSNSLCIGFSCLLLLLLIGFRYLSYTHLDSIDELSPIKFNSDGYLDNGILPPPNNHTQRHILFRLYPGGGILMIALMWTHSRCKQFDDLLACNLEKPCERKWAYLATDFLEPSSVSTRRRFSTRYPDDLDRDLDSLWRLRERGI